MDKFKEKNLWLMALVAGLGGAIGSYLGQHFGWPSAMAALGGGLGAYLGRLVFPVPKR